MLEASVAVIGGSGLYDFDALTDLKEVKPDTPFGQPSDIITITPAIPIEILKTIRNVRILLAQNVENADAVFWTIFIGLYGIPIYCCSFIPMLESECNENQSKNSEHI